MKPLSPMNFHDCVGEGRWVGRRPGEGDDLRDARAGGDTAELIRYGIDIRRHLDRDPNAFEGNGLGLC
jgi:hypothetical protein